MTRTALSALLSSCCPARSTALTLMSKCVVMIRANNVSASVTAGQQHKGRD